MALTRKLTCSFLDNEGGKMSLTFGYIKSSYTAQAVNAFMDAIIANGSIYKKVPATKLSAVVTVAETTEITIESE